MTLSAKLARLRAAPPTGAPAGDERGGGRVEVLRSQLNALVTRQRERAVRERSAARARPRPVLPGRERPTHHGPVQVVERILEPAHRHGRVAVRSALSADPRLVAILARDTAVAEIDLSRMVFFDTETTGLAGGTGTLAFLVGLGWFDEGVLTIEQLLLPRPGQEGPMLRAVAERIEAASCLVSYNGKSFDWPLLRTRFVLNRVPAPPPRPHLDLLHCARRVFKRRLGQVRLVHVEEHVLGHRRQTDIDGAEIPEVYFDYLRGAEGSTLVPVIEHNAEDLVALAALLGTLGERIAAIRDEDDPRDLLGFAQLSARAGDVDRALGFARATIRGATDARLSLDALCLTARIERRRRDFAAAAAALVSALALGPDEAAASALNLSLAKLYELAVAAGAIPRAPGLEVV